MGILVAPGLVVADIFGTEVPFAVRALVEDGWTALVNLAVCTKGSSCGGGYWVDVGHATPYFARILADAVADTTVRFHH